MNVDNSLSREFLSLYPVEAARVLEQIKKEDAAAFLTKIPSENVAVILEAMLPPLAASCLGSLEAVQAAKLLQTIPGSAAARIYRLMNLEKQKELSTHLSKKYISRMRRILDYASLSAGDMMNPNVDMLPESLTVADAIRRMERYRQSVKCEIVVVDNNHRFVGVVDLSKLLTSKQNTKLSDIMSRSVRSVSVHATAEKLSAHPGWKGRQRLPVVESDNTLVGILDYARVKEIVDKEQGVVLEPTGNIMSLAGLYWLSMVQLLDSLLNIAAIKKGDKP